MTLPCYAQVIEVVTKTKMQFKMIQDLQKTHKGVKLTSSRLELSGKEKGEKTGECLASCKETVVMAPRPVSHNAIQGSFCTE